MSGGLPPGLRGCLGCVGLLALLPALALLLGHPGAAIAVWLGLLLVLARSRRPATPEAPAPASWSRRGGRRLPSRPAPRAAPTRRPAQARARGPIPARLRFRILERDGFRCRYCGRSGRDEGVVLHADHVVPVAAGGETTEGNLVTACEACNLGKGAGLVRPPGWTGLPSQAKFAGAEETQAARGSASRSATALSDGTCSNPPSVKA